MTRHRQTAWFLGTAATAALLAGGAGAQVSPVESASASQDVSEVIVTGTRVKRDGYSAPTPETVVTAAEIERKAVTNIADYVNQLPALSAGSSPRNNTINVSSASAGGNYFDLRGLGENRTLVLLDGRRVVGSTAQQTVDANTLPTSLLSRIDIVTGGASAAYGSDAVSGVVNFVLDTRFTGLKATIQVGETDAGDNFEWRTDFAGGAKFAAERGQVIASVSYAKSDRALLRDRDWFRSQKVVNNPAFATGNGQPRLLVASDVSINNATPGGLITSGVLRGTEFLLAGGRRQFDFGTTTGAFSLNATPNDLARNTQLEIPLEQYGGFGRVSYDVSDGLQLFAEGSYSKVIADSRSAANFFFGNLTMQRDNAFLPDDLRAQLDLAGQSSFRYGKWLDDLGTVNLRNQREVQRYVVGLEGELPGDWSYSAYAQYGRTDVNVDVSNLAIPTNYRRAIDAVRNLSGQVVCRVNAVAVTDAGCMPVNPFGATNASPEALAYFIGVASLDQVLEQTVAAATLQGEPFSTWAGPVSLAAGVEHRKEEISSTVDPGSQAGIFIAGNYKPTIGDYSVTEGFVEIVAPLAKDLPFLQALDLSAAYRRTHYSTSGSVNTWKLGLTWEPVTDIRFRATRSRDIRAPNLNDLYQGGVTSVGRTVFDNGPQVINITSVLVGNPALTPEIADSLTVGFVAQPSAVPGLSFSVDYYDIKIRDSIQTLTDQQIVDRCNAGNAQFCSAIVRNTSGAITDIARRPSNLARERVRGVDVEATFTKALDEVNPAWTGRVTARILATRNLTRYVDDGIRRDEAVAENTGVIPEWKLVASLAYDTDRLSAVATARAVSDGVYDRAFGPLDISDNHIEGATYVDLAVAYRFPDLRGSPELFANVDNIFDKDPVIVAPLIQQQFNAPVNGALYDVLGRSYRAGFRLKF